MKKKKSTKCKCGCGRKRSVKHRLNETCKNRIWRAKNPIGHAYNNKKKDAKRRKLEFAISLEYFKALCLESGYIEGTGTSGDSLTIDRKKNWLGYIPGNLQVITRSANSSKFWEVDVAELAEHGIYVGASGFGLLADKNKYPF